TGLLRRIRRRDRRGDERRHRILRAEYPRTVSMGLSTIPDPTRRQSAILLTGFAGHDHRHVAEAATDVAHKTLLAIHEQLKPGEQITQFVVCKPELRIAGPCVRNPRPREGLVEHQATRT